MNRAHVVRRKDNACVVRVVNSASRLLRTTVLVFVAACGGGDGGTPTPPPSPPPAVATVTISPDSGLLDPGQTLQFNGTVRDPSGNVLSGRAITWTTSDSTKATVSVTGLVTALAGGDVAISAICEGKRGSARLAVTDPGLVDVRLASPNGDDAALLFTVTGGPVLAVEGAANEIRARPSTTSGAPMTILVRGAVGPGMVARLRVPDRLRVSRYMLHVGQAVARGTYLQRDVRSYMLQLARP